jgi:hypothetical protein
MAAILLRCSWSHVHILQLWIFSFWWYLDYVDLSFHGRMWSYHVVTSRIFTLSIFPLNIWLFFVGMTYFIRKRSFSACAKICWKLAGFYTKFGKKKHLNNFSIDTHNMKNIIIFLFLGSSFYVQIGPKGIEFARYSLDYHTIRNYLYVNRLWGKER